MSTDGSARTTCMNSGGDYRKLYYKTICVPIDSPTIKHALETFHRSPSCSTITLMPGIYYERIELNLPSSKLPLLRENRGGGQQASLCIRAASPEKGATLMHCSETPFFGEEACVHLASDCEESESTNRGSFHLEIQYLNVLHYTKGNNIWEGNTCVRVNGKNTLLSMENCTLQSDSGRGIVVTRGAQLLLRNSIIHDCAATGLYVGVRSFSLLQNSNIIRNGFGTRRPSSAIIAQLDNTGNDIYDNAVPPGHSGVYIESTNSVIDNCLLAGNCLTALSVVRGGMAQIQNCDLMNNGSDALTVHEINDLHLQNEPGFQQLLQGGIEVLGGGNNLGPPVTNPRELQIAKYRFRTPMPDWIYSGPRNITDQISP